MQFFFLMLIHHVWPNSEICVAHASWKFQVVIGEESFRGISGLSFVISLTRPTLMFNLDAIVTLYAGWNLYKFWCSQWIILIFPPFVSDRIYLYRCRKCKICWRSAGLLAITRSFNVEIWVSTWKWKGSFSDYLLNKLVCLHTYEK